ncbi:MAG: hypothetical protein MMC33_006812 [Icmadophila ericetorum]|nr:hypothetical protein [Icmadophila ericetorum]
MQSSSIEVYIGAVTEDAARWWAAILAPGQGWKAIIAEDGSQMIPPWLICMPSTPKFVIRRTTTVGKASALLAPPSSNRAFEILEDFYRLHSVGSQFLAALAAAITLPAHRFWGRPTRLPMPAMHRTQQRPFNDFDPQYIKDLKDQIPHYLTVGGDFIGIISSLRGLFWEPRITCNLASAWLHPPNIEVPNLEDVKSVPGRFEETTVRICAIRRPEIAPLWLGAAITGLTPLIMREVKSGTPPLNRYAAAWFDSPQHFVESPTHESPAESSFIRRSDVWRLTHILNEDGGYPGAPLTPWEPFGKTRLQDTTLSVQIHQKCRDHRLTYVSWSWELDDGTCLIDKPPEALASLTSSSNIEEDISVAKKLPSVFRDSWPESDTASEQATSCIFQYVTVGGEGFPPSERDVYMHDWTGCRFADSDSEPDDGANSTPSLAASKVERLEGYCRDQEHVIDQTLLQS